MIGRSCKKKFFFHKSWMYVKNQESLKIDELLSHTTTIDLSYLYLTYINKMLIETRRNQQKKCKRNYKSISQQRNMYEINLLFMNN